MLWYIAKDGKNMGPLSDDVLRLIVKRGELKEETLVWRQGFSEWRRAGDVPGLLIPPELLSEIVETSANVPDKMHESVGDSPAKVPVVEDDTPKAKTEAPETAVTPIKGSYLGRHWRGQLSLPISYWVNTFLLNVLVLLILAGLSSDEFPTGIRVQFTMVIIVVSGSIAIYVWQIVGVWRSANHHIYRTKKSFWARAAQTLCVFGVLGTMGEFMSTAPYYNEIARIAIGIDDYSDYGLTLLENGEEVEISGGIGFGLADDLSVLLTKNPGIKTVHLNSYGGRTLEARLVRDIIEHANLATYTSTECLSACTIAYLAGNPRSMKASARFGFHQYSFPGLTDSDFIAEVEIDREYMAGRGLSDDFVDNAFSKAAEDMWYPSATELKAAGFVNEIVTGDTFANTGTSFTDFAGVDFVSELEEFWNTSDEYRVFRLLGKTHPEIKSQFFVIAKRFEKEDGSWEDFQLAVSELGREIGAQHFPRYLAYSQESELIEMLQIVIDFLRKMLEEPGDACYTWMFGGAAQPHSFSEADTTRMLAGMAGVIETAIDNPAVIPDANLADTYMEDAFEGIVAQEGEYIVDDIVLLNIGATSLAERRRACSATLVLYEYLLDMESPKGIQTIRLMFSLVE